MIDLCQFVTAITESESIPSFREAFNWIAQSRHIGLLRANVDGKTFVLFEGDSHQEDVFITVQDQEWELVIYKNESKEPWNEAEIKAIGEVALSCYQKIIYKDELEHASLIQFNTRLPNSFGMNQIIKEKFTKDDLIGRYSLVSFNVKGFSRINKIYSVEIGNLVIKLIANELRKIVKDNEILAHQGSDSFIALIKNTRLDEFIRSISPITINVRRSESEPDSLITLYFTISVVKIDRDYKFFSEFFSDSSLAQSYAKANGMQIIYFDDRLKNEIETAKNIEMTIDEELAKNNILIYYQPKVDIRNGEIIGAEALARWEKDGTIISPNIFIPILEKTGDIVKLDLFVLDTACHDISNFRKLGHHTVPLSCNISRRDLLVPGFYRKITQIINKYDLHFEDVIIEVTETRDLSEKQRMQEFVSYLSAHNVKTSLDDFGSGFSSLSLVRDFDVHEIKVDRSFIDREYREKDAIIIDSIVSMAKKLGLNVIIEGVETYEQLQFVKKFGCTTVQGYYFDKPLPKLEFEAKLLKLFYDRKL